MADNSVPANRRILIVDDNPAIHDDFLKILTATRPMTLAGVRVRMVLFAATSSTQIASSARKSRRSRRRFADATSSLTSRRKWSFTRSASPSA